MKSRKGFTLIELMVVVLIVGILAAVAIPIMRGRIDAAKWSEGKAGMGTIATALRAYAAEAAAATTTIADLGFVSADLDGTYFDIGDYSIASAAYNTSTSALTFTIQCDNSSLTPTRWTLTESGVWASSSP